MAVPNLWRTKKQRYSLVGEVCTHCSSAVFPPREICPHCHKPMQTAATVQQPERTFVFPTVMAQPMLTGVVGDD
jgi:uncharacterized OB-fold protein